MTLRHIIGFVAALLCASGAAHAAGETLQIPPLSATVKIDEQPVRISVSGSVATAEPGQGQEHVRVNLDVDLSDVQAHITELLRPHLNESNRCGLRLNLEDAELAPRAPDALLRARVHVEKYLCAKALGRQMITRLAGGEGTVVVRLTPAIENAETLKLSGEVVSVQAEGALGELLQSEPAGSMLREKIRDGVASTLQRSLSKLKADLPPAIQGLAALQAARFTGSERLGLALSGDVQASADMVQMLIGKLKEPTR